jgi:hypothetical protein
VAVKIESAKEIKQKKLKSKKYFKKTQTGLQELEIKFIILNQNFI